MLRTLFRVLPSSISNSLIAGYYKISLIGNKGSHSLSRDIKMPGMTIKILPALQDNYMYLIVDNETKEAAIIDPVEPDKVVEAIQEENVKLTSIMTTHHHWDHSGGNKKLSQAVKGLTVYGGDDRVDALTKKVTDGTKFNIGSLSVKCLHTPCHTTDHICYVVGSPEKPEAVFTGDTLFIGGCGKFFEGDAQMMYTALIEKLSALPDDVKVYCGHEYTVQNLKFAKIMEPGNGDLIKKLDWAESMRQNSEPTVPSTIGEEKKYNPFMRVGAETIQVNFGSEGNAVKTMKDLRHKKDVTKIN